MEIKTIFSWMLHEDQCFIEVVHSDRMRLVSLLKVPFWIFEFIDSPLHEVGVRLSLCTGPTLL